MGHPRARGVAVTFIAVLGLALSACGGGETVGSVETADGDATGTAEAQGTAESASGCDNSAVVDLIAEAETLEGQEREDFLLERAAREDDGVVTLYTEMSDWEPIQEAFSERYEDLSLNVYRAPSDQVRQRILEESAAGFSGADLLEIEALEMVILEGEGILAPAVSPYAADVVEAGQFENFTADRFSYIVPLWNTDLVSDPPESLEDFADGSYDNVALEDSDVYWFAVLVQHLQEEEGMTEEEAIDLFRRIAANSTILHGHTTTADLVVAGQHAITPNGYAHRAIAYQAEGAPAEWLPVDVPVVAEVTAVSVLCTAANPAGALLLQDWFLAPDGAQQVFVDVGRTPSNVDAQEEALGELDIEPIRGDVQEVVNEFEKWSELWDEVLRGA